MGETFHTTISGQ